MVEMIIDIYYTIYCRLTAIMWTGCIWACSAHQQQILLHHVFILRRIQKVVHTADRLLAKICF